MYQTHRKGEIACCEVKRHALDKDVIVSKPEIEARYDLVLDVDGKLYRAQVKYVDRAPSGCVGSIEVDLRKQCRNNGKTKKYSEKEVDVVLAFLPSTRQILWIPPSLFSGRSSISFRTEPAKNGQKKGVLMAQDYVW
jgi:hypothetical protein